MVGCRCSKITHDNDHTMTNDQTGQELSRRKLLKTAGAAAVGTSLIPAIGTAKENPSADEMYRAARQVREQTGSTEKFRRVLKNQGAEIATKDIQFKAPWWGPAQTESDGGISPQKLDSADCSLQMTMTIYTNVSSNPYVDLSWEHTVTYDVWDNDVGEQPYDIAGLTYEQRDYDLVSGSWYGGNSTSKRSYNNYGVAFNYADASCQEIVDATGECTPNGQTFTQKDSCGMQIIPDETTDPSLRTVYADYWHTYQATTIQSVSISSAGEVSVTLSDETYKWLKEADISEDEADYETCC